MTSLKKQRYGCFFYALNIIKVHQLFMNGYKERVSAL